MPIGLLARAAAALGSCDLVGPTLGEVCPSDAAVAKRVLGRDALAPPMGAGKFSPSPFDSPFISTPESACLVASQVRRCSR